MRKTFIQGLIELAEKDDQIWLLCGDLGYSVLEPFAARFPDRFLNVGVAEQNMIGVAAGLALSGKQVFCYSIANFPIMRCLEQIRNDVCYHQLKVRIVAVGGGFAYGSAGYSHHGLEDLAVMRALPNLLVAAPGDPAETRLVLNALAANPGPAYLRLGKGGEPSIPEETSAYRLGDLLRKRPGDEVIFLTTGAILGEAVAAADILDGHGIQAGVVSMPILTPFDRDRLLALARQTRWLITVEEHTRFGGLGELVASILVEAGESLPKMSFLSVPSEVTTVAGSQTFLRRTASLDAESLAQVVLSHFGNREERL